MPIERPSLSRLTLGLLTLTAAAAVLPAWSFSPIPPPWIEEIFLGADEEQVPVNVQPVVLWGRWNGGGGLYLWNEDGRPIPVTREIDEGRFTRLVPDEHLAPGSYQLASAYAHPEGALDTAPADTSAHTGVGDSAAATDSWHSGDASETGAYGRSGEWTDGLWFTVVDEVDEEAPDAPSVSSWSIIERADPYDTGVYTSTDPYDTSHWNPATYESLRLELDDPSESVTLHMSFLPDQSTGSGWQTMRVLHGGGAYLFWLVDGFGPGQFELYYVDRAGNASEGVTLTIEPVVVPEETGDTGHTGDSQPLPVETYSEWGEFLHSGKEGVTESSCGGCQSSSGGFGWAAFGLLPLLGLRRRRG